MPGHNKTEEDTPAEHMWADSMSVEHTLGDSRPAEDKPSLGTLSGL
jgi:hypothetical protein